MQNLKKVYIPCTKLKDAVGNVDIFKQGKNYYSKRHWIQKKQISIQESNKINNQCKGAENSQNTCAANILGNLSSAQAEKASKRKNAVQRANKIEIKKPKL